MSAVCWCCCSRAGSALNLTVPSFAALTLGTLAGQEWSRHTPPAEIVSPSLSALCKGGGCPPADVPDAGVLGRCGRVYNGRGHLPARGARQGWPQSFSQPAYSLSPDLATVLKGDRHLQVFLTPEYLAIAMEYATDGDMFQLVVRQRGLLEGDARWHFQQLIVAVDYCHRMVRCARLPRRGCSEPARGILAPRSLSLAHVWQEGRAPGLPWHCASSENAARHRAYLSRKHGI